MVEEKLICPILTSLDTFWGYFTHLVGIFYTSVLINSYDKARGFWSQFRLVIVIAILGEGTYGYW